MCYAFFIINRNINYTSESLSGCLNGVDANCNSYSTYIPSSTVGKPSVPERMIISGLCSHPISNIIASEEI